MSKLVTIQKKLHKILQKHPGLKIHTTLPWDELEFQEIAKVVELYLLRDGDVINEDPLQEWFDEYRFWLQSTKSR